MKYLGGEQMRIGIDVDNTITNTMPILIDYCKRYNDKVIKRNLKMNEKGYSSNTLFAWTDEENLVFCNKYLQEIVLQAEIKENAREIIEKIKNEDNEIYIITARSEPNFIDPYNITKGFLDKNNIVYDKLIVNCEDKYTYCKENSIDIMIDDEPQHINSISKMMPVIVFEGLQNEDCSGENVIKLNTWNEVYEEYAKIKSRQENKLVVVEEEDENRNRHRWGFNRYFKILSRLWSKIRV